MSSYQTTKSGTYHLANTISSPSILKKFGRPSLNNVPGRKVRFDLFNNIKLMLTNYDKNNDKDKLCFNNLICDIRDSASEIEVSQFKTNIHLHIYILKRSMVINHSNII